MRLLKERVAELLAKVRGTEVLAEEDVPKLEKRASEYAERLVTDRVAEFAAHALAGILSAQFRAQTNLGVSFIEASEKASQYAVALAERMELREYYYNEYMLERLSEAAQHHEHHKKLRDMPKTSAH